MKTNKAPLLAIAMLLLTPGIGFANDSSCKLTFHFPSLNSDKEFVGTGNSDAAAEANARSNCVAENFGVSEWKQICANGKPKFRSCQPYDGCRALRVGKPKHNTNYCLKLGYMGYDPAPEGHLGRGVCFKREECRTKRPIDPF